jgi:NADPH:quinone reductase-like Zn-dependent oxidoreductase
LLIESKVAAVNPLDNLIAHGDLKLVVHYKLPQTVGNEFVGIVKRAGSAVKKFPSRGPGLCPDSFGQYGGFC